MRRFGVLALASGALTISSLTVSPSHASPYVIVKPVAIGIGFGSNEFGARLRAGQAWETAVRSAYGQKFAKFSKARSKNVSCAKLRRRTSQRRGMVIGTSGSPTLPWSCTAMARPVFSGGPPPRPLPLTTSWGYGHSATAARGLAVRAWSNVVRALHGPAYSNYGKAMSKSMSCVLRRPSQRHTPAFVKLYEGDPRAPWMCSARGRPYRSG